MFHCVAFSADLFVLCVHVVRTNRQEYLDYEKNRETCLLSVGVFAQWVNVYAQHISV